jgi:Cyclic nucleotide-binding domain
MTLPLKHIIDEMNRISFMPEKFQLQLMHSIVRMELPKDQLLLERGQQCDYLYYIEKGILSCHEWDDDNEKEYYTWLMFPGDIATSVESFNSRVPSVDTIRTVTHCTLHALSWKHVEQYTIASREFGYIRQRLTDKYHFQGRNIDAQRKRPPEQFYEFLKNLWPEHFDSIPNKVMASFMGISEALFYKIEKNNKRGSSKK